MMANEGSREGRDASTPPDRALRERPGSAQQDRFSVDQKPTWTFRGTAGAAHFLKTVHGILCSLPDVRSGTLAVDRQAEIEH